MVWDSFRLAVLSSCLLVSAWVGAAARDEAGELQAAQEALAKGDYARAFEAYRAHVDDNGLAQFSLALFYANGWGRPVDPVEACRWQEKAAQRRIPAAEQALGDCLRHGVHRPADPVKAAHWYREAIDSGIATAACSLAELYMVGEGVPKDPQRAIRLCRGAADKGLPVAQVWLARLFLDGDPSIRNPEKAVHWLQIAAQADYPEARYRLGLMLRDGIGHPVDPVTARWWLESAASQGWLPAYVPTAELYFHSSVDVDAGRLPPDDLAKAYMWSAAAVLRLPPGTEKDVAHNLLDRVVAVMPESWRPDLDRRVDEHLAQFASTGGERKNQGNEEVDRVSARP